MTTLNKFDGIKFNADATEDFAKFLVDTPTYAQDEVQQGDSFYNQTWFLYLMYVIAAIILIVIIYYIYKWWTGGTACESSADCGEDETCNKDKKCVAK